MYLLYIAVLFLALLQTRASAHEFSCGHHHLSGPEGQVSELNEMLAEYYEKRGWVNAVR